MKTQKLAELLSFALASRALEAALMGGVPPIRKRSDIRLSITPAGVSRDETAVEILLSLDDPKRHHVINGQFFDHEQFSLPVGLDLAEIFEEPLLTRGHEELIAKIVANGVWGSDRLAISCRAATVAAVCSMGEMGIVDEALELERYDADYWRKLTKEYLAEPFSPDYISKLVSLLFDVKSRFKLGGAHRIEGTTTYITPVASGAYMALQWDNVIITSKTDFDVRAN